MPGTEQPWVRALREREALCRRAPSAHNTQPWTLRYGPGAITIGWSADRELPAGDPTRRDLHLALGAFVETCLTVAADAGLSVRAEIAVDTARRTAARLLPARAPHPTPFTSTTVTDRTCARGPHLPGRLTPSQLTSVRGALTGPHTLFELPARALTALAVRADRHLFGTAPVATELRAWLRLHPGHPRYRADGLTYEALALSRTEAAGLRAVLAPRPYALLRRLGLARLLAGTQRGLLRHDGSVLVFTGPRDMGERDLVRAGQDLVRTWYALTELGLAVHPLSQLIDNPDTAASLGALLPADAGRVLAVFRAGRPAAMPARSARLAEGTGAVGGVTP
ncbi:hypothetical protein AB0D04_24920 [Streptomyces sp. NPDC048483]|uniref:hypothetical protein n=1 Tax=Streptomyces sp. NPDC048483 TaxID=3154927 RepID=UPI003415BDB2